MNKRPPPHLPKKLQSLDAFLLSDAVGYACMTLSELDGFLAGLIVCPEAIQPSEWMPVIWGTQTPDWQTIEQAESINADIMWLHNTIARHLKSTSYQPIFDFDHKTNTTIWEQWPKGFHKALSLRPTAWLGLNESGEAEKALATLLRLHHIATTPPNEFNAQQADQDLMELATDMIPFSVHKLHHAQPDRPGTSSKPGHPKRKAGRNDPCPCGSGKKHKKCCLS